MFAVIKTGGKQYKVAANDVLKVEKVPGETGDIVTFDEVLMVGNGDFVTVGAPLVAGASVAAEFLENKKNRTVLIIKKHRRQHYDRRNGHRQLLSSVRITEILLDGAKPTIEARVKKAPAVTDEAPAAPKPKRGKAAATGAAGAAPEVAEATSPVEDAPAPKKAPAKKAAAKKAATKSAADDAAPAKAAPKKRAAKPKAEKE